MSKIDCTLDFGDVQLTRARPVGIESTNNLGDTRSVCFFLPGIGISHDPGDAKWTSRFPLGIESGDNPGDTQDFDEWATCGRHVLLSSAAPRLPGLSPYLDVVGSLKTRVRPGEWSVRFPQVCFFSMQLFPF